MGRKALWKEPKVCENCGKEIKKDYPISQQFWGKTKFCSRSCSAASMSKTRIGKRNPAYRNGLYTTKNFKGRRSVASTKHLRACSAYRKDFLSKNHKVFCEVCGTTNSLKFEVHHIYFASLYPRHPQLHNFKNLVMVCIECHNKFHAGKTYQEEFQKLEKDRGLKELFKKEHKFDKH